MTEDLSPHNGFSPPDTTCLILRAVTCIYLLIIISESLLRVYIGTHVIHMRTKVQLYKHVASYSVLYPPVVRRLGPREDIVK
jgi:hypothetical protein